MCQSLIENDNHGEAMINNGKWWLKKNLEGNIDHQKKKTI
jgi:hypothetical protein